MNCAKITVHDRHEFAWQGILQFCNGVQRGGITLPDDQTPERLNREGDSQPMPIGNDQPIIHHLVQQDLEARLQLGVKRYGQGLQAFNGRSFLQDAYDEILDLAVYLKGQLEEVRITAEELKDGSKG